MDVKHWIRFAVGAVVVAVAVGVAGCSRSAQSYLERGNASLAKGNVDAAVLEFRNAVQKNPMFGAARLKLAEAYLKQGHSPIIGGPKNSGRSGVQHQPRERQSEGQRQQNDVRHQS